MCFLYICRKIKTKTCFYTCFSKTAWRVVLKAIFESGSYWEDLKNCKLLHSEQDVNFPDISKVGVHLKGQQWGWVCNSVVECSLGMQNNLDCDNNKDDDDNDVVVDDDDK